MVANDDEQMRVTFRSKPVAKFLLVARNGTTKKWTIPSQQRFHDVLNVVENAIYRDKLQCTGTLEWSSTWEGGIGLLGLRIDDVSKLTMFRNAIYHLKIGELRYNTFPKAALPQGSEISVILRAELRHLALEVIPYSLFDKNPHLDGQVGVRFSKDLASASSAGVGSEGSRMVVLQGDDDFFASVANHPYNHSFKLGSSWIKLRSDKDEEDVRARSNCCVFFPIYMI